MIKYETEYIVGNSGKYISHLIYERSTSMSESLNLFRLQRLDDEIDRSEARLGEIRRALSDDQRLVSTQKKFERVQEEAKQIRIKLRQIEDKVEAQRIKRKKSQTALFSGNIKNPKELQDLQMETESLKRYIAQLEDEQLEAMFEYETAEENLNKAEGALVQLKGTLVEENAALFGEKTKLEEELNRLAREKEAVLQAVSTKSQMMYNQLRERKRGTAVATVSDDGCSICGQSLTPADLQSIRSSTKMVFCPSCGRILYEG
jgi:uncharacterized protein